MLPESISNRVDTIREEELLSAKIDSANRCKVTRIQFKNSFRPFMLTHINYSYNTYILRKLLVLLSILWDMCTTRNR